MLGGYEHVVIDTPPNLGLLTVNALVCAEHVIAPVSAEDEASIHGVVELRQTISRLANRLGVVTPSLSRADSLATPSGLQPKAEEALIAEQLAPAGRIPSRSALVARAADATDSAGGERARQLDRHSRTSN